MAESLKDAISSKLVEFKSLTINTQQLRRRLIQNLRELFEIVSKRAEGGNPEASRIAGYIAQVLSNTAKSYEERELNEDLEELERPIQWAKALGRKQKYRGRGVKLDPRKHFEQLTKRRQFKLFLNPTVYKAFRLRCKIKNANLTLWLKAL